MRGLHARSHEGREKKLRRGFKDSSVKGVFWSQMLPGHEFTDAIRALILHQTFYLGALYELDLYGEITTRLIEQINMRFFKSRTLHKLTAEMESASFITLIYGEISFSGRFYFVSAGHPPPLVFSREFDRFVEISPDRLVSYPPLGLQLNEDNADARLYQPALGYMKHYTVNELNLIGQGDVLLLYTDGLIDPFFYLLARTVGTGGFPREKWHGKEICQAILEDRKAAAEQTDDLSLAVIKYR